MGEPTSGCPALVAAPSVVAPPAAVLPAALAELRPLAGNASAGEWPVTPRAGEWPAYLGGMPSARAPALFWLAPLRQAALH